jgi:hypothetical protein
VHILRRNSFRGVQCAPDTTTATLNLSVGFWRHSNQTLEICRCKHSGDWSPCSGGAHARYDGDGYCKDGYHGPRCELCEHSEYFDEDDARCYPCDNVAAQSTIVASCAIVLLLIAFSASTVVERLERSASCPALVRRIRSTQNVWRLAGMRCKLKALVGFYQCVAAVPSVYNVVPPLGMEEYTRIMNLFALPSELERILVPTACLGHYSIRIWIGSTWPAAFLFMFAVGFVIWELVKARQTNDRFHRGAGAIIVAGLHRVLPLALWG